MFEKIINRITIINKDSPTLVCIDGSGKSHFAKFFVKQLQNMVAPVPVILCSVDNFHNEQSIRYQKGKDSAEGFYKDSYNYHAFIEKFLTPFVHGRGEYVDAVFDVDTNQCVNAPIKNVPSNAIVIVEGIFLQRPELKNFWDLSIFLDVSFDTALSRNIIRDKDIKRIGRAEQIVKRYQTRYKQGQLLYFADAQPKVHADIVIDNNDFNNPYIM